MCGGRSRAVQTLFVLNEFRGRSAIAAIGVSSSLMDKHEIEKLIAKHGVETVKIGTPDMDGVYRGKRLSTALTYLPATLAVEKGITKFATALIRDGNHSESFNKKGELLWTHRYVLFSKNL